MGYTHYWEGSDLSQESYEKALPIIQDILGRYNSIIRKNYDNDEPPVADEYGIWFNGIGDEGHETFVFDPKENGFHFCKTACKKYDIVVCEVLTVLKHFLPDLRVSSDGFIRKTLPDPDAEGYVTFCEREWLDAFKNVSAKYGIEMTAQERSLIPKQEATDEAHVRKLPSGYPHDTR